MKKTKLIYLEWEDAMSSSKWRTHEEALEWGEKGNYIIHECGWVLKETKKYILLSSMFSPKDYDYDEDKWGNLERIPKTWIKRRIDFTEYIKGKFKKEK